MAELARMVRAVEELDSSPGVHHRVYDALARDEVEDAPDALSIHQYRVTGVIGRGGMGTVYMAEHELLRRPAAIKVLVPELSRDQDVVSRLFNEARAATAIRHPGIVEIYDVGWTAEGDGYIVMELLEGESLAVRLARAPLPWRSALAVVRQIAGALAAAHAAGIVHRDLKPDNVFVTPDPEVPGGERIKLLDFGIAKLSSSENLTRIGAIVGTPAYMAPEQCRGVAIDHRADLYALGCVLFALCTGRPPFAGEGAGDMIVAHIQAPPPALVELGVEAPRAIERLLQRLLAKAPAERTQSAAELIGDIDAITAEHGSANPLASGGAPPIAASLPVARGSGAAGGRGQPPGADPLITTLSGAAGVRRPPPAARSRRWRPVALAIAAAAVLAAAVAIVVRPDHDWRWSTSAPISAIQPRPGGGEPGTVVAPDAAVATDAAAPDAGPMPAPAELLQAPRARGPAVHDAQRPAPAPVSPAPRSPAPRPPVPRSAETGLPHAPPDVDLPDSTGWVAVDPKLAAPAGVARGHRLITSPTGGRCPEGFVCLYQNEKYRGVAYGVSEGGAIYDLDKVNCPTCKNGTRGNDGTFHRQMSSWHNASGRPYCWYDEAGLGGKSVGMPPHTRHGQVLPSNDDQALSLGPC
ncbi:MAG TPA: serine/threonine-protein kinase [Kofleriaceae bacterium]|nr:serine/threonine-protein kinase [Kofleriaceae bacterium]